MSITVRVIVSHLRQPVLCERWGMAEIQER
jgi:hypothetical protein